MSESAIPDGYHTVNPYLVNRGAAAVVDLLVAAFGAEVKRRLTAPDGRLINAEVRVGDSMVMLGEAEGDSAMPGSLYLYVEDVDATYSRALAAGAESLMEPADMYYGDRNAGVKDSAGNCWWIATHVEDVDPEEMERRAAAHEKRKGAEEAG